MVMNPDRTPLLYVFLASLDLNRAQRSIALLSFGTSWPTETSHFNLFSHNERKQRIVHGQGASRNKLPHRCCHLWGLSAFKISQSPLLTKVKLKQQFIDGCFQQHMAAAQSSLGNSIYIDIHIYNFSTASMMIIFIFFWGCQLHLNQWFTGGCS